MGAPTLLRPSTVDAPPLPDGIDTACRWAVDTDEVAAHLEANGVNDRVAAREYGASNVFALASRMRAERARPAGDRPEEPAPAPVTAGPGGFGAAACATLIRAALYLTPAVVAIGGASQFGGLPVAAGPGALIFGWASAQALAFLGYRALGTAGPARAARLLAAGFVAAALGWAAVLLACGVTAPRAHAVAVGQLALFAATAVALVTGTERRVLAAAGGVWAAALVVGAGGGALGLWLLAAAVAVLLAVAYAPAVHTAEGFRPGPAEGAAALAHGAVGAGQAVLFVSVVLAGGDPTRVPLAAVPLLLGVPLAELVLVAHQRRVAATRAAFTDRRLYRRRLTRVAAATLAVLAAPVLVGTVLVGAALTAGGTGRLAASVLLTSVYALCLVLVAHRRLGLAALLVWWPAVLVGVLYRSVPGAVAELVETLVAVVLFAVCVPALGVVAMVLRDRWSYR